MMRNRLVVIGMVCLFLAIAGAAHGSETFPPQFESCSVLEFIETVEQCIEEVKGYSEQAPEPFVDFAEGQVEKVGNWAERCSVDEVAVMECVNETDEVAESTTTWATEEGAASLNEIVAPFNDEADKVIEMGPIGYLAQPTLNGPSGWVGAALAAAMVLIMLMEHCPMF